MAEQHFPSENVALRHRDGAPLLNAQGLPVWREKVSPLRTFDRDANCDAQIDAKYHSATLALVSGEFFAGRWSPELETKFLMIRDQFIVACKDASAYDWYATIEFHKLRKSLDGKAKELGKASRRFLEALKSAHPLLGAPPELAYILRCKFENEPIEQFMTAGGSQAEALLDAFVDFAAKCSEPKDRGSGHFQFGPIHYHNMDAGERQGQRQPSALADCLPGAPANRAHVAALAASDNWQAIPHRDNQHAAHRGLARHARRRSSRIPAEPVQRRCLCLQGRPAR